MMPPDSVSTRPLAIHTGLPKRGIRERPIPFSAPMVRALLNNTKTQTRRLAAKGTIPAQYVNAREYEPGRWRLFDAEHPHASLAQHTLPACPYGQPGDRLWVREAWKAHTTFDHLPPRDIPESHVWYMADDGYKAESRYRHARFMPRWVSRILLEVVGVRVERLQEISEADAAAEGTTPFMLPSHPSRESLRYTDGYRQLWEQINGAGSWADNPWVWVVEFKRISVAGGLP